MHKEPSDYRVAHHGYFLRSCSGQEIYFVICNRLMFLFSVNNDFFFKNNGLYLYKGEKGNAA